MNALFLHERAQLLEAIQTTGHQPVKASRLFERWQEQAPFRRKPEWFDIKLKEEGIDRTDFLKMVEQPDLSFMRKYAAETFALKNDPLRQRLQGNKSAPNHDFYRPEFPELGFLNLFIPLFHEALKRLQTQIEPSVLAHPHIFGNLRYTASILQVSLWDRLLKMVTKTMVLELHVFKLRGKLRGNSSEERFTDFVRQLNTRVVRDYFYRDYPVLIRQAAQATDLWVEQSALFVQHLASDFADIQSKLFRENDNTPGRIRELRFGQGDAHRGGRTVAIVTFENGQKVVYKPRALHIDAHFQQLLNWLNSKTDLDLKTIALRGSDTHGWVEFIEHTSCETEAEILHFYQQTGAYIALLYALEATDFHYENIVAHGKYPQLIDLESFFHPYFPMLGTETNQAGESSVLRTGLLPMRVALHDDDAGIDISGLSDTEGKASLFQVGMLEGIGTDEVKVTRQEGVLQGAANVPMLRGQKVKMCSDYIAAIKSGFVSAYRALIRHRTELTDQNNGLIRMFKTDDVRVLFRDTFVYTHLLDESWHPQIQRNGLELERHFDWLWAVAPDYELIRRLVKHEKRDLLRGDVPLFTTKVNSRHLWFSDEEYLENFFSQTGLELVCQRLELLTEADLERQLWLIEASLVAALEIPKTQQTAISAQTPKATQPLINSEAATPEALIAEARRVGDYLYERAFKGEKDAQWIALKTEDDNTCRLMPMYYDLFSGASGEILFLAYLHDITQEEKYRNLAENALDGLLQRITYGQESIRPLGLFAGWGSVVYALTHLAKLWNRPDLTQYIEHLYDTIDFQELITIDKSYGLVKGSAGFMAANLSYYQTFGSQKALQWAVNTAENMMSKSEEHAGGIGWRFASKVPLAGMSHGASGVALAFSRLYQATGEQRYARIVNPILHYERSLFVETQQNWKDCRDVVIAQFPNQVVCSTGWAHGAPGIGMARLELLQSGLGDTQRLQEELTVALNTTLRAGFSKAHSLTMGSFGSLELIFSYGVQQQDADILEKSSKIASALLQNIQQIGWNCGLPNGLTTPGLMTGVTGIGYQCLRMAAPDRIPSILMTACPF